jgi:hypothetical protein
VRNPLQQHPRRPTPDRPRRRHPRRRDRAPVPPWLDWFSPVRLAAFKGNTQLKAGHLLQARESLLGVLDALEPERGQAEDGHPGGPRRRRAASRRPRGSVPVRATRPGPVGTHLVRQPAWTASSEVRRELAPHQHERCVRELDDRLYDWTTTVSALAR